jgi:predicted alpha-1,2-mannosidase
MMHVVSPSHDGAQARCCRLAACLCCCSACPRPSSSAAPPPPPPRPRPARAGKTGQYANYNPRASQFSPYLFNATLTPYGTASGAATIEVTPTSHGAVMRFTFPPPDTNAALTGSYNATRRVLISLPSSARNSVNLTGAGSAASPLLFTGAATDNVPANGALHFVANLLGAGDAPVAPLASGAGQDGSNWWAWADFDAADAASAVLTLRIATSLISPAQALAAHGAEVAAVSFDGALAAAKAQWHALATRITVGDIGAGRSPQEAQDLMTIFYSSLYRASRFPRALYEDDYANDKAPIHWSPYKGTVLAGELSSDVGFWDAFRTTFSLLSLVKPDRLAAEMEGFLNTWRENGFVPQWPHPNGGGMAGTMSDVTFSEAIAKLPHCGSARAAAAGYCVNASALYAASRQNAFSRQVDYITYGYMPAEDGGTHVSDTLLNWHADWAVAQAATALGFADDAAILMARANNFTALLDPTRGFFTPRLKNGSFIGDFDQYAWGPGPGYTEAGPWQYRVEVPYAPQALKTALAAAGYDGCAIVQQANTIRSTYHAGGYGGVIHEQAEMAANCWAQWELNNQPVRALQHMQVAFDTAVTGACAQQAQPWLRKSAALFRPGADMFPGDEDNGSMGAWYILNALGLYPLSPASGEYVLGSPLFGNVSITIDGASQPLTIVALNQGPANVYVHAVEWNGVPLPGVTVPYASLMQGGVLQFTMASTPAA